jgi:hypothetical protein
LRGWFNSFEKGERLDDALNQFSFAIQFAKKIEVGLVNGTVCLLLRGE